MKRRDFIKTGSAVAALGALQCTSSGSVPGKTANTKFAVNLEIWWKDLPIIERIRKTAELGFPAVEFWDFKSKDLSEISRVCRDHDLTITQFTAWGFKPGMNHPENHDLFEAQIRQACQAADILHCNMATVVAGDDIEGMTQQEMHAHVITALKRVAPIVEEQGLTLILEPMNIRVDHPGHCLYGSEPAIDICRAVNSSHVKINWDLYHMHISEGDLCGHLREGIDWIGYVQVADHPGRNEPGTGEICYNRVFKELAELRYNGFVGLECWPREDELTAAKRIAKADIW